MATPSFAAPWRRALKRAALCRARVMRSAFLPRARAALSPRRCGRGLAPLLLRRGLDCGDLDCDGLDLLALNGHPLLAGKRKDTHPVVHLMENGSMASLVAAPSKAGIIPGEGVTAQTRGRSPVNGQADGSDRERRCPRAV